MTDPGLGDGPRSGARRDDVGLRRGRQVGRGDAAIVDDQVGAIRVGEGALERLAEQGPPVVSE